MNNPPRAPGTKPASVDPRSAARRITAAYLALGMLWITSSDQLVQMLIAERYLALAQTLKGYAFVLLTGGLLYFAIARLLTRQRETQQRLSSSEHAYRAMFESNPNPMFIYDPDSLRFLAVNAAAIAKYGFSREEFLASTLWDIRPPEAHAELQRALDARKHFGDFAVRGPIRHWTRDRRIMEMQITAHALEFEGVSARLVLAQDISEEIRIEREMQKSRLQLKEAQRIAALGSWSIDHDSGAVTLSEQMLRLIGADPAAQPMSMQVLFARVHPDDRAGMQQAYERAWHGAPLHVELRALRDDGEIYYMLLRGELVTDRGGHRQLIGTSLDISDRKRAEKRLQESERQYRQLVDLLPEAVFIHRDNRVVFANPATATLFGAARTEDVLGADIYQFMVGQSRIDGEARVQALQRGLADADTGFQERLLRKLDGEVFAAEVAAQFVMIDGEKCIQAMVRDIGQQKKVRMELQVANERLLSLSTHMIDNAENERMRLSRELHDDLGQTLTFIKMTAAWLRKRVDEGDIAERVAQISTVAGEALEKVRDLALTLRPAQLDALGLKAAMEEHLQKFFNGSGIDYAAQIETLQPRPQPALETALFRIFQEALTNIVRHSGASFVEIVLARRDGAIELRIVDDGRGFDVAAALASRASLGLHTMTERAQQLHGTLQLHSVAGVGTEMSAIMPESPQ